jgi:hypothetical protein
MTEVPFFVPWIFSRHSMSLSSLAPSRSSLQEAEPERSMLPTNGDKQCVLHDTDPQTTYSLSSSRHTMLSPLRGLLRVCACVGAPVQDQLCFCSSDDDSLEPLLELSVAHLDIAWPTPQLNCKDWEG